MKSQIYKIFLCIAMLLIVYRVTNLQYQQTKMETATMQPFESIANSHLASPKIDYLPRGIVEASSDMELKSLWLTKRSRMKDNNENHPNLLAIPAGSKQMKVVDAIVEKFFSENFTIVLFHYDGNVDGWHDFQWSRSAIHVVAYNQTKWWFAKRFLHPDVVSVYDYIFLWDEDLGVEDFHPGRYLKIVRSEGLEISQPALDPDLSEIHHRITIRRKKRIFHRRVHDNRGSVKCSNENAAPPCTGWVEGMAPVFSRSAWRCVWHLIQNDLIHGWGLDMKLGYCAQGDRTKKVGVVDSEFIVHQGIQTLGGSSTAKVQTSKGKVSNREEQRRGSAAIDMRTESRRRAKLELQIFHDRWNQAIKEDETWVEPFQRPNSQVKINISRGNTHIRRLLIPTAAEI